MKYAILINELLYEVLHQIEILIHSGLILDCQSDQKYISKWLIFPAEEIDNIMDTALSKLNDGLWLDSCVL